MLNKRMRDFPFHTKYFSIIWSINYNASVIGSNIQYDVMKQPGETVSAGQCRSVPLFYNERVSGRECSLMYNERMCDM